MTVFVSISHVICDLHYWWPWVRTISFWDTHIDSTIYHTTHSLIYLKVYFRSSSGACHLVYLIGVQLLLQRHASTNRLSPLRSLTEYSSVTLQVACNDVMQQYPYETARGSDFSYSVAAGGSVTRALLANTRGYSRLTSRTTLYTHPQSIPSYNFFRLWLLATLVITYQSFQ